MNRAVLWLWLVVSPAIAADSRGSAKLAWSCESRKLHSSSAPPLYKSKRAFDQQRSFTLINSCDTPVQVGFTSGAMCANCNPSVPCPAGGLCHLGSCYFPSLLPSQSNPSGNYLRMNPGQKANMSVPISGDFGFGGALFASTGCDSYSESCETAICAGKVCDPFTGPVGPHTRAEFFMDTADGTDYYDVSLIHGVNVPIAMTPFYGVSTNNFTCQAAGSVQPLQQLPGCSYKFNPALVESKGKGVVNQTANLLFVAPPNLDSPQTCDNDSQCASPLRCGLAADRTSDGQPMSTVTRVCGKPVGMWSANEVCIYAENSGDPFNCQQPVGPLGGRNTDLYGCTGPYDFSGYDTGHGESSTNVCGCFNWKQPADQQCTFDNPDWESVSFPWANLLKQGCPTAYSYPYDDMSSSFHCMPQSLAQPVAYQFEFCPQGTKIVIG